MAQNKRRALISYTVRNFAVTLKEVEYVKTFKDMIRIYEMAIDQDMEPLAVAREGSLSFGDDDRYAMDAEEEAYFADESEDRISLDPFGRHQQGNACSCGIYIYIYICVCVCFTTM